MVRAYKRGAEVKFVEPDWLIQLGGIDGLIDMKEQKKKELDEKFNYPADRSAGCGDGVIRKRKQKLIKTIDIMP